MLYQTLALATAASPKHIVFFLIDDYGFGDASYKNAMYDGKTAAPPTPTIDALAMSGVRLESYYVNKLCSPTRTALLSGRYAYTIGQDDGVIINGQNVDMPLNLRTIGDHFQRGGWNTSAYGKWDAGMTAWGSTPSCRGFDHYRGFYSAASDYFKHTVGPGFDYHTDERGASKAGDPSAVGVYTTEAVTSAVQGWITGQIAARPEAKTFAYVAHEAVHGPMEVPERYIGDTCRALVGDSHGTRLIYCGMVRAVDESVANITATYEKLGILNDTLFVLSADNGGIPADGGSNYPLRGNKATAFEGGVRGLGFVSGAGLAPSVRGTVSHEIMHVTDWLPTLAGGAAGLTVDASGRPCPTCNRSVAPLDGVDQWAMLSMGAPSARTEVLLDLQTTACIHAAGVPCDVPGSGAIRVGKWKLMHGHSGVWDAPLSSPSGKSSGCTARSGFANAKSFPFPVPANESNPWCPFGWTPPPRADGKYELPIPAPDIGCTPGVLPCAMPVTAGYLAGHTMLFDVEADMFEEHDVAAANPDVVAKLLARLQVFNSSHCGGSRCEPDDAGGPKGKPAGPTVSGLPLWLPWRGDPAPAMCDTDRTPPPTPPTPPAPGPGPKAALHSSTESSTGLVKAAVGLTLQGGGWCWDGAWTGGGVPPMTVRLSVDGTATASVLANVTRSGLPAKTGAPNPEHGFALLESGSWVDTLGSAGKHRLDLDVFLSPSPTEKTQTTPLKGSPLCFQDGDKVSC